MTNNEPAIHPTLGKQVLASLPYVTLLGCAGILANIALSFEEPHTGMLIVSGVFLAVAPVGMALHLAFSHEFTPDDRRKWMAGLMSRRGLALFAAYFSSSERQKATEGLASEGSGTESRKGR